MLKGGGARFTSESFRCRPALIPFLLGAALAIAAAFALIACRTIGTPGDALTEYVVTDQAAFVLDRLKENRIVMLGDGGHGEPAYLQSAVACLDAWVDSVAADFDNDLIPHHLLYVIERDSLAIADLRRYWQSGDLSAILTPGHMFSGISTLEYWAELRRVLGRVDSLNAVEPTRPTVRLDLLGPEMPIDLHDWSFARRNEFFLGRRDSLAAEAVIRSLDGDQDAKVLAFYGLLHLTSGKVMKQIRGESQEGYYLAEYLRRRFAGAGGVYRIEQMASNRGIPPRQFITLRTAGFAIDLNLYRQSSRADTSELPAFDGFIWLGHNPPTLRLNQIYSQTLVDILLNWFESYRTTNNDFVSNDWAQSAGYFMTMTGQPYRRVVHISPEERESQRAEWRAILRNPHLDLVDSVVHLRPWLSLIRRMKTAESGRMCSAYERLLATSLWVEPFNDTDLTPAARADYYRDYVNERRSEIVQSRLVGVLWVGTEAERTRAREALTAQTGRQFDSVEDWTRWWQATTYSQ